MVESRPGTAMVWRRVPRRWQVVALFACIVASWGLFTLAGRALVRLIYEGRAPAFLNGLMTRNEGQPVSDFYRLTDATVFGMHFLLVILALIWLTRGRRSPWLWFGIFLAGVVGFVLLDLATDSVYLKIWHEHSVPEWLGYATELIFAWAMYGVFKRRGERLYLCLSLLGVMLFLDDSLQYHEMMGRVLAPIVELTGLHRVLEVESHYLGEILSLVPYGILALLGSWFYLRAGAQPRRDARVVAALIVLLFAFGVILDFVSHIGLWTPPFQLAWIEDSAEMVIESGLAAFGASVLWRESWD
ncbi:MAG TPA: hypothetical protein VFV75_12205 [Candidatus Polarisedimenticolaceae bacterium]|nr:hypothetical protein [Candidatus Polarisedimenticolaceae bacterium]